MKQYKTKIYIRKTRKKYIAALLIFAMLAASYLPLPGINSHTPDISKAASNGNALEREFDTLSARFAASLNEQMERYLNGDTSSADRATVETDFTEAGLKSTIRFHLGSAYEYPLVKDIDDAKIQVSRWINQAIATYPSLCTLVTNFNYTYRMDTSNNRYLQDLTVYSPVAAGDIKTTTSSYNSALARLTATPSQNTMTGAEKVLLVHDRLVSTGDYYTDTDNPLYHTAQSILLEKKGVCESYAYCFNHAMARLGIDSLLLHSTEHAWNAVRLDNKWYYVDATWDDPNNMPISYVGHQYFLVPPSAFEDSHTMTTDYNKTYGSILRNMGNAYDNYFPKQIQAYDDTFEPMDFRITRAMSYMNGMWYYSNRIGVYTWDGKDSEKTFVADIPTGYSEVCSAVYNNVLYYSNSEGVFRYRPGETDSRLAEGNITAMTLRDNTLYYTKADGSSSSIPLVAPDKTLAPDRTAPPATSEIPIMRPTPTAISTMPAEPTVSPLPKETPDATTSPNVEVVPPAKPVIKSIKNFAPRGFKVKIKSVPKAVGYQISYSLNKNFKNAKKKLFTKTVFQKDKLKRKKTYYVRVRAYTVFEGEKRYSKWSGTKKIKIKK